MRWIVPLGRFRPADKSLMLIPWEFCPTISRIRETRSIVWTRLFGLDWAVFRSIGFLSCSIKDEPHASDRVDDNAPPGEGNGSIIRNLVPNNKTVSVCQYFFALPADARHSPKIYIDMPRRFCYREGHFVMRNRFFPSSAKRYSPGDGECPFIFDIVSIPFRCPGRSFRIC